MISLEEVGITKPCARSREIKRPALRAALFSSVTPQCACCVSWDKDLILAVDSETVDKIY